MAHPPVTSHWYAEWDGRDNRWLFANQETGERTFTYPGQATRNSTVAMTPHKATTDIITEKARRAWLEVTAAGAASVAGGALLMHLTFR